MKRRDAGFAEESNKRDTLMVECPLGSQNTPEWRARMQALKRSDLTPQLFLSQDFIEGFKHEPM